MGKDAAAARAGGTETEATVLMTHGADALLEMAGEDVHVRWPAAEIAAELGAATGDLPGLRLLVTVRETPEEGRVLSGFRMAR